MESLKLAHNLDDKKRTRDVISKEELSFDALLLPDEILTGLTKNGFRRPSPIQIKAIPLGRCGFDLVMKSKSGTGKTLVFSVVALEALDTRKQDLQVVILVPTREIAVQIEGVLKSVGENIKDLKVHSFIGGLPIEDDIKKAKKCHIAVGAPGRVKHLLRDGHLKPHAVKLFVLDEADKLMEDSFQGDVNEMFHTLPKRKQIIASSATYPKKLDSFLANYMLSPIHVSAEVETPVLLGLRQFVKVLECAQNVVQTMRAKNEALLEVFTKTRFTQCLVFMNYQTRAESVSNMLNQKGWKSTFISAAQSQVKRLEAVNDLKEFKSRIMLSTDLTSRGIDASNVDLVINYDIPHNAVTYLHRMGRAGRFGSSGICINLAVAGQELQKLQHILGTIGSTRLSIAKLPGSSDDSQNLDLWTCHMDSLEQIHGTVPEAVSTDDRAHDRGDLKNGLLDLKEQQADGKWTGGKKARHKNDGVLKREEKVVVDSKSDCITEMDIPTTFRETGEKIEDTSAVDMFQQLASGSGGGNIKMDLENSDLKNTENLLETLAAGSAALKTETSDEIIGNDSKRRKCNDLKETTTTSDSSSSRNQIFNKNKASDRQDTNSKSEVEDSAFPSKNQIFIKNKAMLAVTQLLSSPTLEVQTEAVVHSIDEHLTSFKLEERLDVDKLARSFADKSVEEILKNSTTNNNKNKGVLRDSKAAEDMDQEPGTSTSRLTIKNSSTNKNEIWLDLIKTVVEDTDPGPGAGQLTSISVAEDLNHLSVSEDDSAKVPENIFEVAYNYAVNASETHWMEVLTPKQLEDYQKACNKVESSSSSGSEEDDYCYDLEEEEQEEEQYENYDNTINNFQHEDYEMQDTNNYPSASANVGGDNFNTYSNTTMNLPMVPQTNESQEDPALNDHYADYYRQMNDLLWARGLSFETVQDFDTWYWYEWHQQLMSVRSYVQQNIYVREMSRYQQSRQHHNNNKLLSENIPEDPHTIVWGKQLEDYQKACNKVESISSGSGDDDYCYDLEEEEEEQYENYDNTMNNFQHEDYEMQDTNNYPSASANVGGDNFNPYSNTTMNLPMVPQTNEGQEDPALNNDHYADYYRQMNDSLWARGLSFETVQDFDSWYWYEWQQQLMSVRSYVQQNIYVREMSRYQQSRQHHNNS